MKVIVLAGGFDQISLINELKSRRAYVILIDYLENPPAKTVADKHYKESTLDIEAVTKIAKFEKVDLITTACTDQALLNKFRILLVKRRHYGYNISMYTGYDSELIKQLQKENMLLREKNSSFENEIAELTAKLNWFEEQYCLSKHSQFGCSSEKTTNQAQMSIFSEDEISVEEDSEVHVLPLYRRKQSWKIIYVTLSFRT